MGPPLTQFYNAYMPLQTMPMVEIEQYVDWMRDSLTAAAEG